MTEPDIYLMTQIMQEWERKREETRRAALASGDKSKLYDCLLLEIGRMMLCTEDTLRGVTSPQRDDEAVRKELSKIMGWMPWPVEHGPYHIPAVPFRDLLFRSVLQMFAHYVMDWIETARAQGGAGEERG